MEYVDKNKYLKKLQQEELKILLDFDKICRENNIKYYLAYGTLLGTIRHSGFIPWDDDIDVHMTIENYHKLCKFFESYKGDLFLQNTTTEENYYLTWAKIRRNNTLFVEKGWEKNKINNGLFIDIFPLYEYPDKKDLKKYKLRILLLGLLLDCNIVDNKKYKTYGRLGKIIYKILRLMPKNLRKKYIKKYTNYIENYKNNNEYYYLETTNMNLIAKKSLFTEMKEYSFENHKFYSVKNYDEYLKINYNDYMKLPKIEERNGHGEVYLCFDTKNEKKLKK